ncbi:mannose-6-phosphate isomerase, class I [Naasia sp. SYSU D00057]|uniref:mannose-6-phosphate isomerase, class I n=1 Tax=Naasia sp. SYSU D00057 TaxID=2817380 RepID=UPI001B316CB2|nr:mannose-6-phosphate isomerase, class I [Naasia sp. SYSU D00057]
MFVEIANSSRQYTWGSPTAIAEILGREPELEREAELWFGAHPISPSRIRDSSMTGGCETLDEWIAADPETTLGPHRRADRLPFLLKLLAADEPLSLQAHPSIEQARDGYAREDAAGIPLQAPNRTYKDELHKPELVVALSETFEALAGFQNLDRTRAILVELRSRAANEEDAALLDDLGGRLAGEPDAVLRDVVGWALSGADDVARTLSALQAAAQPSAATSFPRETATLAELAERHPGDPGALVALLMHRVSLARGEALYLPSGNIHSYQRGLAVEIMSASDNVLRGGLTDKHVDAEELREVLIFRPLPAPRIEPLDEGRGVEVFRPDVPDFVLARVTPASPTAAEAGHAAVRWTPPGAAIVLALGGPAEVVGERTRTELAAGASVFVTPDEGRLTFTGTGTLFVASGN